ncbi:Kdo domain containing protein [Salinimicrobium sp. CDJ15-81-2]|nr:Kdo domain containing protein [Salinimicrobium nanhaiense]
MEITISEKYKNDKEQIDMLLQNFDSEGTLLGSGARNRIKIFSYGEIQLNVKSFKVPNPVNRVVYRFFRKSKAERSFEYAHLLLKKGLHTPFPVAYAVEKSPLFFKNSFYVTEHLPYDLRYRDLVQQPEYPLREEIIRAFTRFTFELHEKGVEFLDHSPGNTLIQRKKKGYKFFLVDLNRMNFKTLSFEERMKNFSRLSPQRDMVKIMASEYAQLVNRPESEVFERMWFYTEAFQKKFHKKKAVKKKIRSAVKKPS